RLKTKGPGRVHGRVSTRGLQPINPFMNTPVTKTTTLWKTFSAERGGVKRTRRLRKRNNEVSHDANTYHHRGSPFLSIRPHIRSRSSCFRQRVRCEPAGCADGANRHD